MKKPATLSRYRQILAATLLLSLATSSAQAEVFTNFQFSRFGNQVIAVPTTYVLVPSYRPARFLGPETWQVRLRNGNSTFTRSYRVGNSALAMQRARRQFPNARLLAVVRK